MYSNRFRVAMADTDAAQVIYFGAPIRWSESLFASWLAESWMAVSTMIEAGFGMPAVHVEVSYEGPLKLDEWVVGELRLAKRSSRSVTWRCEFFSERRNERAVEVLVTQTYVQRGEARPSARPLPEELVALLDPHDPASPQN